MPNVIDQYKLLPPAVRRVFRGVYSLVPLKVRLGKEFFRELQTLESTQWWPASQLKDYQNQQLRRLIRHAYHNVPYYRKLLRQRRLKPADFRTMEDLAQLPVLTKEDVRSNFSDLRAKGYGDGDIIVLSTSGTTGKPLKLYFDKSRDYLNGDPFIWRFFGWAGHQVGQRRAVLSSWTLPGHQLFDFNPVRNTLILSAYRMNFQNVEQYIEALRNHQVLYLEGYPSSIELFTKSLKEKKLPRPMELKGIFTHSEYFYDWQRKTVEDYWSCRCFDWYGMEERVILGVECEKHAGLHLCSDFSIVEFLAGEDGGPQRLIATSLINYAMPMIRYETGDCGFVLKKPCSCGRGFPLFKLEGGREMGFALAKDGSSIPVANIDIPNAAENVFQFQFVQEEPGRLILSIVKKPGFTDHDLLKIRNKLAEKFGNNMDVVIKPVKHVHTTPNGKGLIFIQKMSGERSDGNV